LNIFFRILISIAVTIIVLVGSIAFVLYFFDKQMPKLGAVLAFGAGVSTFKLIKPTAAEIARKTKESFVYHENGNVKEKGKIINSKREGPWDFFSEEGEFIETRFYRAGEVV
jgi:hypothetical protein